MSQLFSIDLSLLIPCATEGRHIFFVGVNDTSWVLICVRFGFCACVSESTRRLADGGTLAECLPFRQFFDVTRACCDNEHCALLQGEDPAVCPRRCQSTGPTSSTHVHSHACSLGKTQ